MLAFVPFFIYHNWILKFDSICIIIIIIIWKGRDAYCYWLFRNQLFWNKKSRLQTTETTSVTVKFFTCQGRGIFMKFNLTWFFCSPCWHIKRKPVFICLSWYMFLIKPFEEISPPCEKVFFYPFRIKFKTLLWYFGMSLKKYLILCSLELSLYLSTTVWC